MQFGSLVGLAACAAIAAAQSPPVTILEVTAENVVFYHHDVSDPAKLASSPTRTSLTLTQQVFKEKGAVGDIVAVNGRQVRGVWIYWGLNILSAAEFTPGRPIADRAGNCATNEIFLFLAPDGTEIGTIVTTGVGAPVAPPGSPESAKTNNMAVIGGTGAFLGIRGQMSGSSSANLRHASAIEDPAYRRLNGGGTRSVIFHLIPMSWPEVLSIASGPAVYHGSDMSPVTAQNPAQAGERLVMAVEGLGPVRPNLGPGRPFPPYEPGKLMEVNSPVEVTVNGKAAAVQNKVGWPTMTNVYRVDFTVPDGTAPGMATLGLSMAWINGPEVKIPLR